MHFPSNSLGRKESSLTKKREKIVSSEDGDKK